MNFKRIDLPNKKFLHATAENITKLKSDEIFVFGSNLSGIHGKGAAKLAKEKFGAQGGVSYGLTGQSFAIPTRGKWIPSQRTFSPMDPGEMGERIYDFLIFARTHPDLFFLVTKIGCGNAGFKTSQMSRLFSMFGPIPKNVSLPVEFWAGIL